MLSISESYMIGVDMDNGDDEPVITITKADGCHLRFVKVFTGTEARELYKKITDKPIPVDGFPGFNMEGILLKGTVVKPFRDDK